MILVGSGGVLRPTGRVSRCARSDEATGRDGLAPVNGAGARAGAGAGVVEW